MHEYKYPSQFLTDVTTAAGLLEHGRQSKALAKRIADEAFRLRSNPEAADALAAKEAEIEKLRIANAQIYELGKSMYEEKEALQKLADERLVQMTEDRATYLALRANAQRYQWIRGSDWECFDGHWLSENDVYGMGPAELDAYIDAAIRGTTEESLAVDPSAIRGQSAPEERT